ncbi:MAG: Stf0 sulfotransferase family protein [Rhodobacteraceae bacterium]|nr:Stf0 sulfotransferase family protein [Paracoccaceae bacterium]
MSISTLNSPDSKNAASVYFEKVAHNQTRANQIAMRPMPDHTYVVYFTPRSGSSRLTEILSQTKNLGEATEAFNPNFLPEIAQAVQAKDMQSYIENLSRWLNRNGVFGFEITGHQLNKIFPQPTDFFDIFACAKSYWLIREDIVAQAVSLAKMVTLHIGHTAQSNPGQRAEAEKSFIYEPKKIKRWLNHILAAERLSEAWFARFEISPKRMSYEKMIQMSAGEIADDFAKHLGLPDLPETRFSLQHQKLGTSKNQEFSDQFRIDEGEFLKKVAAERQPMLNALNSAPP